MDYSVLIWPLQALIGAFCAVIWANYLDVKKTADRAIKELGEYRVHVAETYSTSAELKDAVESINKAFESYSSKLDVRLDRIEMKIDNKADK
jgi:methylthioribose-1-phosphate isomerase